MTLSPFTHGPVKPRPDLPDYHDKLPESCQHCGSNYRLENHHALRLGMGWPRKSDFWWCEVPGGGIVPVRIILCSVCHGLITENKAKLEYAGGFYFWREPINHYDVKPLAIQPWFLTLDPDAKYHLALSWGLDEEEAQAA